VEDGAQDVGQLQCMRCENVGLVYCQINQFFEALDVALGFLVKQALN
jgi:hypothetical protein